MQRLKPGKRYNPAGHGSRYIPTKRQLHKRAQRKIQLEYLKTITDTVTPHLEMKLNADSRKALLQKCYYSFLASFDKRGRFRKILNYKKYNGVKADRDTRKCRRSMKLLIHNLKIDFVDLKYSFYWKITLKDGQIQVMDQPDY